MVDYAQRMRSLRVEQLLDMVNARPEDGIIPEAVEAAKRELDARNIAPEEIDDHREHVLKIQLEDAAAADRSLPVVGWIIFMFLGLTLVGFIVIYALHARGRHRMARDALIAALSGLVLVPVTIMTIFVVLDIFLR